MVKRTVNGPGRGVITRSEPAYIALLDSGEFEKRVEQARAQLVDCDLCARYCYINRFEGIRGAVCRTGARA